MSQINLPVQQSEVNSANSGTSSTKTSTISRILNEEQVIYFWFLVFFYKESYIFLNQHYRFLDSLLLWEVQYLQRSSTLCSLSAFLSITLQISTRGWLEFQEWKEFTHNTLPTQCPCYIQLESSSWQTRWRFWFWLDC